MSKLPKAARVRGVYPAFAVGPARKKISTLACLGGSRRHGFPPANTNSSGSIFYGSPCTFLSDPVVSVMFKYIIKVNVGGWWPSVGVSASWRIEPFLVSWFPSGIKEVYLRFLWLEVAVSELSF